MNLSVASVKAFYRSHKELIALVRSARVAADIMRKSVEAYTRPILLGFGFRRDCDERCDGSLITEDRHLYLSGDEEGVSAYYAACDEAHAAHGHDLEPGYCPALVARSHTLDLERALLKAATAHYGVEFDKIYNLELRAKALDLFLNPPTT